VFADTAGTFSFIFTHVSGSPGTGGASFVGGNGHSLQGFPGHRQPLHSAFTTVADAVSKMAKTSWLSSHSLLDNMIFIDAPLLILPFSHFIQCWDTSKLYHACPPSNAGKQATVRRAWENDAV